MTEQQPKFIPLCIPEIRGNEWQYIKECLDTNWISSVGSFVNRFENDLAEYIGAEHAVATVSGTASLHISLLVAGIEPDDEVIVSDMTFIAPANVIRYTGAWPVFIDAEPDYFQMDVDALRHFVEQDCSWEHGQLVNKTSGRRVKAIVPVHILGHPVNMEPLLEIARKYDLAVIEDATESIGASYHDQPVGSFGQLACFSFNGNKLLSTGGGGMIVTNHEKMAQKARHLTTQSKSDAIEYVHDEIGFNYRLTNVLAALGVAQLESINDYIAAKRRIAEEYERGLANVDGITVMPQAEWASSVFWMYTVLVDKSAFGLDSRELLGRLDKQRIQTRPLWQPMHLSPAHKGSQKVGGEVSQRLYRDALSLPCSVGLETGDQHRVIEAIVEAGR